MRRSGSLAGFLLFLSAALELATPAAAQYLYLDSNGDGVHTAADVLSPTGTTTVDVYISTDHNRDGSTANCVTGDGNLTINSYEFILKAQHGTVTWGTFTNRMADFSVNLGLASSGTDYHNGFGGGTILPPGLYKVATLEITPATGTPTIVVAPSTSLNGSYLTSFGSQCSGNDFDNTMKLGGEWNDADGLPYGGVTNNPPVLAQPADMTVTPGTVADQTITATDADGNPLTFSAVQPPLFLTVTTTDPGTGTATGNIHVAPLASDVGTKAERVHVTDGFDFDEKQFQITVTGDMAHPTLYAYQHPAYVGIENYFYVYIYDPDNIPIVSLTADLSSIPPGDGATFTLGNEYFAGVLSWTPSKVGQYPVSFAALDATGYTATASETLAVIFAPPTVSAPESIQIHPGDSVDFTVTADDPDAAIVSLTMTTYLVPQDDQPTFTVNATNTQGHVQWTPRLEGLTGSSDGFYGLQFEATNGTSSGFAFTGIQVHFRDVDHLDANYLDLLVSNVGVVGRDPDNGGPGLFYPTGSYNALMVSSGPWLGGIESGDLRFARGGNSPEFEIGPMANGTFQPFNPRFRNYKLVRGDVTSTDYLNWPVQDGAPVDAIGHPALTGDMMIWSVYNDANPDLHLAGEYANAPTAPVGLEVQQSVFSFNLLGPLGNVAFERLKLVNKGGAQVDNAYVSLYSDVDVGGFAGSDPALSMGYVYNSTRRDPEYGEWEPAVGWQLLQGPMVAGGSRLGMTAAQTYTGADLQQRPNTAAYGLQQGLNIDGSAMHVGNDPSAPVTTFCFNGDPVAGTGWLDPTPGDKRILISSGPFTMPPGAEQEVVAAVLVGQGWDRLAAVSALRKTARAARYFYRSGFVPLPFADAPETVTVNENALLAFTFQAYDLDGDALTGLTADLGGLPLGNNASFATSPDFSTGTLTWSPTFNDAGIYHVTFHASNDKSGQTVTTIRVVNVNRAPVANVGGPYSGVVGEAVTFDGTASSGPDGDALTYFWTFGEGGTGVGATVTHTYAASGHFPVFLTVTDGFLSGVDQSQAMILEALSARAYAVAGQATIRLATAKPLNCFQIEPVNADFEVGDVDLSSIQLMSGGTGSVAAIGAAAGKTAVVSDRDQNGVLEIQACFAKADLRRLFDGLAPGSNDVTVTVGGKLVDGARFTASLALRVVVNGTLTASISPNPMNPEAVLTFRTSREGPVRAALYDLSGRRVRTLLEAGTVAAGYHDVRIDGTTDSGGRLASGIYFVAIESVDGEIRSKVTILR